MDELRKTAEDERRRLKRELALIQEARRKESKEKDARGLAASASVEAALRDVTKLQNEVTELKGKMAAQKREVEDMRAIRDEMRAREVITARQLDDLLERALPLQFIDGRTFYLAVYSHLEIHRGNEDHVIGTELCVITRVATQQQIVEIL